VEKKVWEESGRENLCPSTCEKKTEKKNAKRKKGGKKFGNIGDILAGKKGKPPTAIIDNTKAEAPAKKGKDNQRSASKKDEAKTLGVKKKKKGGFSEALTQAVRKPKRSPHKRGGTRGKVEKERKGLSLKKNRGKKNRTFRLVRGTGWEGIANIGGWKGARKRKKKKQFKEGGEAKEEGYFAPGR